MLPQSAWKNGLWPAAGGVQAPGADVLADARVPQQEHRGVRVGVGVDLAEDLAHHLAVDDARTAFDVVFLGALEAPEGVQEFLLGDDLLLQFRQRGDVVDEGADEHDLAVVVEDGVPSTAACLRGKGSGRGDRFLELTMAGLSTRSK
jgi:hypothetical protein